MTVFDLFEADDSSRDADARELIMIWSGACFRFRTLLPKISSSQSDWWGCHGADVPISLRSSVLKSRTRQERTVTTSHLSFQDPRRMKFKFKVRCPVTILRGVQFRCPKLKTKISTVNPAILSSHRAYLATFSNWWVGKFKTGFRFL